MSSDIYQSKDLPQAKRETPRKRRHRTSRENFDDTVNKDVSKTNKRRGSNRGFRRIRHLMKKPEYSRRFWTIALSVGASILILLIIWDRFFRYSPANEQTGDAYETGIE